MIESKFKINAHRFLAIFPDDLYLRLRYRQRVGFWPNLKEPKRFSEKLQWLKLHDRQPLMTQLADKLLFKEFVARKFGARYVIPVLAQGKTADEFHAGILPESPFVLKTNHDSGSTILVRQPGELDIPRVRAWLQSRLLRNLYLANREWEYKDIDPSWFIEPLVRDQTANVRLNDFKVHCFHGKPRFIQTIFDRDMSVKENWFDLRWQPLAISYFSEQQAKVDAPECLREMISLAAELSQHFPYARIDFYVRDKKPLLGEITFRPYGGFMKWGPDSADFELGALLKLDT